MVYIENKYLNFEKLFFWNTCQKNGRKKFLKKNRVL